MKKKFLSILLCLCMTIVLLPANIVFAENASIVKIGSSTELSAHTPYAVTDELGIVSTTGANESNWNLKFENGKLTLKDAKVKTIYVYYNGCAAIYANGDLTVELTGTNEVNANGDRCHSIYCGGNLTIQGAGSLTANTTGFESSPIFTKDGDISIESGTFSLVSDDDDSSGIYAYGGDVNISGGTITAFGKGTANNGIGCTGAITITGGTITAKATSMAFNKAPILDEGYYCASASENIDGTPSINYNSANISSYKYIKISVVKKGIFAGRYSYRQVFDCQRNPSLPTDLQDGAQFSVSSFALPMNAAASSSAPTRTRFAQNEIQDKIFYFKTTGDSLAPFSLYMANDIFGAGESLVSAKGNIYGLASKGFLYISNDSGNGNNLGYFISNEAGYEYGAGLTYTPVEKGPVTVEQAEEYVAANINPQATTLSDITVKHAPLKTAYIEGEKFVPTGLIVTLHYSDSSTKDVAYNTENAKDFVFTPNLANSLSTTNTSINIEYSGKTATQSIQVSAKALASIAVKTAPTKTTYVEGEKFNPSGLVITLTYNNLTTEDVAYAGHESNFTFTPDLNTILFETNTQIAVLYGGKTVTQNIEVQEGIKGIFAGRYSYRQVFDCQRNPEIPVSGSPFTVSSFAPPYDSVNTSQFTELQILDKIFYFKATGDTSAPFSLYMADDILGTGESLVSVKGNIYALGVKGFLYVDLAHEYGYFISNEAAYNYGDGFTYNPNITGPISKDEGDNYAGVNVTPEEKVRELTPNTIFNINTMTLTQTTERIRYSVDGGLTWSELPADSKLSGVTAENGIQVKKLGNQDTTLDSNIQIIEIEKATPTVESKPTFNSIKAGTKLSDLTITNGVIKGTENNVINGTYTWKTPDDIMSDNGEFDKIIIFTPENILYNAIEIPVKVNVYKIYTSSTGTTRYTIKYNTAGGSTISSISVTRNTTTKEPTAPVKDGYSFEGWYTDSNYTTKYDFTTKVVKSITLYAKWAEKAVDSSSNEILLTIGKKDAMVFGEKITNDVAPIIVKDRTMLPSRFVAENLGATVAWEQEEYKVTITKDDTIIIIYINSDKAYVNDKEVTLDSPAFIENDRTYTPLRFVAENLGATVEWNESEQQVTIKK